ncbi:MAG: ABC transporter permease [Ignavibacteriales bacterium]|nr:ABC transporter permease [Ignavibacteriales bacterium]
MKFLSVARWEFLEKIKSKAFLISLVLLPVIMVAFGVLPGILVSQTEEKETLVGIIDETGKLYRSLEQRLAEKYALPSGSPVYVLRDLSAFGGDPGQRRGLANAMVAEKEIEGYFTLPASVYDSGAVEYRSANAGNLRIVERFGRTIEEVIMAARFSEHGYDATLIKKLMTDIDVTPIKLSGGGKESESGFLETFFSAYIFIMMLMFLVLTSGQLLIRSVVEEKSNRVIEVLLSSCSANDLMIGKILGLSGLGLFQVFVWLLIGAALTLKFGSFTISLDHVLLMGLYFVLGYLLYAAIFVGAGSPVTTEQEAQQITTYVSLTLVFPIVLAVPAMQNPDSILIKVLTFVPLLTPAFMLLRIPIQMPPLWEVGATLAVLLFFTLLSMWLAGRIFRIAILVYGKRPSLVELARWIRTP